MHRLPVPDDRRLPRIAVAADIARERLLARMFLTHVLLDLHIVGEEAVAARPGAGFVVGTGPADALGLRRGVVRDWSGHAEGAGWYVRCGHWGVGGG